MELSEEQHKACTSNAREMAAKKVLSGLKKAGLTRPYYLQIIKECCEATKSISCISGKDAGSGSVDFVDVPDYRIRLDAVKTIIDLYGDKAPTKQDVKFPDKDGNPQEIGGMFTDMERAAKLVYLLDQASKRDGK